MRVSVIIPVYNAEEYIFDCLESICNQTYKNIEIIIVNDGSTDNSELICLSFKKKDSRIKYIKTENNGVVSAWINGVKRSSGKYIVFVDSDDILGFKYVERLVSLQIKYSCDLVVSGYTQTNFSKYEKIFKINNVEEEVNINSVFSKKLGFDRNIPLTRWGKLISRQLLEKNIMYVDNEQRLLEDTLIVLPILMDAKNIVISNSNDYLYRITPNSITNKYQKNFFNLLTSFYFKYYEMKNDKGIHKVINEDKFLYTFISYYIFNEAQKKTKFIKVYNNAKTLKTILNKQKIFLEKLSFSDINLWYILFYPIIHESKILFYFVFNLLRLKKSVNNFRRIFLTLR